MVNSPYGQVKFPLDLDSTDPRQKYTMDTNIHLNLVENKKEEDEMEERSRRSNLTWLFVLSSLAFVPNVLAPSVDEILQGTKQNSSSSTIYLLSETNLFILNV